MLILTRKKDEKVIIADNIELSIVDIKGEYVKLGIKAPSDVKVYRYEVFQEILKANQAALASSASELNLSLPGLTEDEGK